MSKTWRRRRVFDTAGRDVGWSLLGYPTVECTGAYADPVTRRRTAFNGMQGTEAFRIADRDVHLSLPTNWHRLGEGLTLG